MELSSETYKRIDRNGDTYVIVFTLPGNIAICVREADISGGADQVSLWLMKLNPGE